jgi:hypothetical protein
MDPIKVFFIEPTEAHARFLRRYSHRYEPATCPVHNHYHQASFRIEDGEGDGKKGVKVWPPDDPRWPTKCECGYEFVEEDARQLFTDTIYVRPDTGEKMAWRDAPEGAMWYADWMIEGMNREDGNNMWRGPDGHCLIVRVPRKHDWMVDGIANNCTRKEDKIHKCWVRHGDVRSGNVHVDKNGDTCAAGAGSILTGDWHGFLHNGFLVTA